MPYRENVQSNEQLCPKCLCKSQEPTGGQLIEFWQFMAKTELAPANLNDMSYGAEASARRAPKRAFFTTDHAQKWMLPAWKRFFFGPFKTISDKTYQYDTLSTIGLYYLPANNMYIEEYLELMPGGRYEVSRAEITVKQAMRWFANCKVTQIPKSLMAETVHK